MPTAPEPTGTSGAPADSGTSTSATGARGKAEVGEIHGAGVLSLAQVCSLALKFAWTPTDATRPATAAAIALAESGGKTNARCYNYRDATGVVRCSPTPRPDATSVDRGLWQINNVWHPEVSDTQADDPLAATSAAFRISAGFQHFTAWSTYTNGAYKRYLALTMDECQRQMDIGPDALTAALAGIGGAMVGAGGAAAGAVGDVAHAAVALPEFLAKLADSHTWLRVVQVIGGLGAVALGLMLIERDMVSGAVGAVADTAGAVAEKVTGAGRHVAKHAGPASKEVAKAGAAGAAANGITKAAGAVVAAA